MTSFTIDSTAETLLEVTAVTTPTNDTTPDYTFSTNEAGTITYGGSCSSSTTSAISGNNPITLNSLIEGTYSNCTITVTDSLGHASSALSVSTFVVDTTPPYVSSFTISPTALKAGDTATVRLVFSEAVASFSSDDDITHPSGTLPAMTSSNNITWTGTFTPTADTEDASNTLSLKTSYTDTAGNAGPSETTENYAVDTLAPSVSSIVISSATGLQNSFLNAGDVLSVTVTFSENSPVTGTPQLTLAVGDENRTATYASSDNGGTTLVFQYTILAGDTDTNGISIRANALALNNGTIKDLAGNNATLTHSAVDNNSSYKVDTTPPSVDNFTMDDKLLTIGDNATVTLVFSEPICGDSSGCSLTQTGGTDFSSADITSLNGSLNNTMSSNQANDNKTIWTGTFTPTPDTEYDDSNRLSLATSYTDLAGNNGPDNETENYEVDTRAPTVSSVAITSAEGRQTLGVYGFVNAGDNVSVTATFSEAVIVDNASGTPTLTLVVGSDNRTATYMSHDNATLVFEYTIQAQETDSFGISIPENALDNHSSTIRDVALNYAILTHSVVGDNSSYKVDTVLPTVSSVAITGEDGIQNSFLNAGDNVSVTATFSETVNVSGNPTLTLVVGSDNRTAAYISGDNSTELVFRYTIDATGTSGENDSNGISIGANALALNSGTIRDAALNDAILTHSVVDNNSSYKVDTVLPTVSVAITGEDGIQNSFLNAGDNVSVTATFSETVNVSGSPTLTLVVGSDNRTAAYISGDNSTELVFRYMIDATGTSGENDSNGISIPENALALNSGTIRDAALNDAILTHSVVDNNSSYKVDTVLPTVSVAITGEDGKQNSFLNAGDNVSVTATFSETVNVSGSPTLTLVVGNDNRTAAYISGDNSTELVFEYMIEATGTSGENDSNGISIPENALALNGGTIRDAALNDAILTHSVVDNNSSYKVDTTAPSVDNFTISDTLLTIGETMAVTLVFSEAVCTDFSVCGSNVFSNDDITVPDLDNGTTPGTLSTMTSDNNDNETWRGTFTPATNAEDNSSRLSLGTSYTDLAGNNGPDNQTENFEIDTLAPTVVNVAFSSELTEGRQILSGYGFLNEGDNVSVTATFSERVIVDNSSGPNPTITLVVGSDNRTATYTSHDNATLVFEYTIQADETDSHGISIPENSLDNHSSTIRDVALNYAILTHDEVDDNDDYIVDTTPPTVSSVAITSATNIQTNLLNAGDNVSVTATFSESVIVDNASGTPTLTLVVGGTNRTATYTSGSGSTPLVF